MLAPDEKLKFSTKPYLSATPRFASGADTPRDFLERCLADLAALEPNVGAFVNLNLERARAVADQSTVRWREGRLLSPIDGMPVGIKDIIETADMPTENGSPLFAGFRSERDAASVAALAAFTCHVRESSGMASRCPNFASTAAVDFGPQPRRPG